MHINLLTMTKVDVFANLFPFKLGAGQNFEKHFGCARTARRGILRLIQTIGQGQGRYFISQHHANTLSFIHPTSHNIIPHPHNSITSTKLFQI
jgi:hypothetical protein